MSCPVCEAPSPATAEETVDEARLFQALADEFGVEYKEADRARWFADGPVRLLRCGGCGLGYFEPRHAGDDAFYGPLVAAPAYYSAKWEFPWVQGRIASGARVLDVGAGRGAFLDGLASRCDVVGVELDAGARAAARAAGLDVRAERVEVLAEKEPRSFDVVTSFHVIEHVEDPLSFARALAALVRPGGSLFVSAPNDERSWRNAFEPLEYPPHHLTRWRSRSIRALARRLDASVVAEAFEPLSWDAARHALEKRIAGRLGGFVGAAAGFVASRVVVPHRFVYARTRAEERLSLRGLAMVFELRVGAG